jgi:DNA-binding SARP family transcriptional activator
MDQSPPKLFLLGRVEMRGGDAAEAERLLVQPKVVALLAYLALAATPEAPGRFVRRDGLVGLLWPELDQTHARAALRKAIHAVRGALGADAVLSRGDEEVAIGEGALWCDAVEFAAAVERGQLVRALELYRGELMPGFHLPDCGEFDRWLEEQRAVDRERAAGAAWALAIRSQEGQNFTEAGQWARRAVRFRWDDERALRRAIVMLAAIGDRAGAARLYDEFARRLRTELDVEPSDETVALIQALRAGQPLPTPTPRR